MAASATPLSVTGVILAGGRSRRMGGRDKGLLPYRDGTLIACALARLAPQVDRLVINANRHTQDYAQFGYDVVADTHDGFLGPLAGVYSALSAATPGIVVCAPCDCPDLPHDLVARLRAAFDAPATEIAVATCDGKMQPVFAAMRTELADALGAFLTAGGRKVDAFYAQHVCRTVTFPDAACFRNINSPAELAE